MSRALDSARRDLATVRTKQVIIFAVVLIAYFLLGARAEQMGSSSLTTYTNDALGFSYTYPPQLVRNTTDFRHKLNVPQTDPARGIVLFSAFETPRPGAAREGVVIMSEKAAINGADWDAKRCVGKITTMLTPQGWKVVRQETPAKIGGQSFFRADYVHRNPVVFQSAVCTIRNGSVLQFILSAGTGEEIDQLFRSLDTIRFYGRTQ